MNIVIALFLICMVIQHFFGVQTGAFAYIAMIAIVIGRAVFEYKQIKRSMRDEK